MVSRLHFFATICLLVGVLDICTSKQGLPQHAVLGTLYLIFHCWNYSYLSTCTTSTNTLHGTCGECLGGFLSPRMRFAITTQGNIHYDMASSLIDSDFWMKEQSYNFVLVERRIQRLFRRHVALRQAFTNIFANVSGSLDSGLVPYSANIITEAKSSQYPITLFTDLGGDVNSALGLCFRSARDEVADRIHLDVFKDEREQLPECGNDDDFVRVAELCGLDWEWLMKGWVG